MKYILQILYYSAIWRNFFIEIRSWVSAWVTAGPPESMVTAFPSFFGRLVLTLFSFFKHYFPMKYIFQILYYSAIWRKNFIVIRSWVSTWVTVGLPDCMVTRFPSFFGRLVLTLFSSGGKIKCALIKPIPNSHLSLAYWVLSFCFFQASLWLGVDMVLQKLTKSYKSELRHLFQCCILIPRKWLCKTPF